MSEQKLSFFHRMKNKNRPCTPPRSPTHTLPTGLPNRGSLLATSNSADNALNDSIRERREAQIESLISAPVINLDEIRKIAWKGIPSKFRAQIWRLFLDYEPVKASIRSATLERKRNDYFSCLDHVFGDTQRQVWTSAQHQTESQILRDLPRTHIALLRIDRIQLLFERVLFVWAVRHPASGYVQGMNDLLQPFFFAFFIPHAPETDIDNICSMTSVDMVSEEVLKEIEADCFWCFSKLLDGLQDLYTKDQPGLYKMLESLQKVVARVDPGLAKWLTEEDINYQEFAFRWINCLLVREFPVMLIFRLWDTYLSNYSKISTTHIYICAAMMNSLGPTIVGLSHADFIMKIQSTSPNSWSMEDMEMLIAQAYVYERMFSQSQHLTQSSSMPMLRNFAD